MAGTRKVLPLVVLLVMMTILMFISSDVLAATENKQDLSKADGVDGQSMPGPYYLCYCGSVGKHERWCCRWRCVWRPFHRHICVEWCRWRHLDCCGGYINGTCSRWC